MDRPLLCSSAHVEELDDMEVPEAAILMDRFANQGIDFVVDAGHEQRVCLAKCSSARTSNTVQTLFSKLDICQLAGS